MGGSSKSINKAFMEAGIQTRSKTNLFVAVPSSNEMRIKQVEDLEQNWVICLTQKDSNFNQISQETRLPIDQQFLNNSIKNQNFPNVRPR